MFIKSVTTGRVWKDQEQSQSASPEDTFCEEGEEKVSSLDTMDINFMKSILQISRGILREPASAPAATAEGALRQVGDRPQRRERQRGGQSRDHH